MTVVDHERQPDLGLVAAPPDAADLITSSETEPLVPDLVEVSVPRGGRVVVVSDLHLAGAVTEASKGATDELISVLGAWDGPGVLVIAGDGFEQLHEPVAPIEQILDAHHEWADALHAFAAGKDHQVIVLPGNHDGNIAWDPHSVDVLRERLGVDVFALRIDLVLDTATGSQKVRVVHGNQDDPYNAFIDPRSPIDTPMGHHVVRQVLPQLDLAVRPGGLLDGLTWLSEPTHAGEMIGSRLLYRRIVGRVWWLALPFFAAFALRLIAFLPGVERLLHADAVHWLVAIGIVMVLVTVVAVIVALLTMLRVHHSLSETQLGSRAGLGAHNAAARERAARLIAEGFAGLVSGHTHTPELSVVGIGFYANSGCGVEVVGPRPARFGLPRPFLAVRRCSRVELTAHEVVDVQLVLGDTPLPGAALLERAVVKPDTDTPTTPAVVGSLPAGATWPVDRSLLGVWRRTRRARRWAAGLLIVAGIVNIASALVGPSLAHLQRIEEVIPLGFPRAASVFAVLIGVALIGLARGVRRGYRPAWAAVVALLGITSFVMIVKGVDIEEGVVNAALALWLVFVQKHFRVSPPGQRRWAAWAVAFVLGAVVVAAALAAAFGREERVGRVLTALGIGLVVLLGWYVTRAARTKLVTNADAAESLARGREIVEQWGGDTLDYFALRDDKSLLFSGEGLVAYTVLDRTMLVSPDPIGPAAERADLWAAAMDHADINGWGIAVLAANASWLPVYHATGLQDIYIGDEAIVECQAFTLQGKAMKSLRGAYNRVSKAGYTVKIFDPTTVEPPLKDQLLQLMTETRQGEVERGFSMTLSRMFDPRDTGLLLAVCFAPDGTTPVAFNQYIPAAAIGGYSLDVMRRTNDEDAPNGLTDFVIIETISWMKEHGYRGLGLNFATFRAVVSGEAEGGPWLSLERKLLHKFSDTMQIESLWRFNQKYDPIWRPRYVITDAALNRPREAIAIARAEGEVEIPVVGRFLKAKGPDPATQIETSDQ